MSLATGDLTTLARVKAWVDVTSAGSDDVLARLIRSASRFVLNYLSRPSFARTSYSEVYDGYGQNFMVLRQWPVLSITSILFEGVTIDTEATGNPKTNGYFIDPYDGPGAAQQTLTLFGHCFPRGRSLVTVNYVSGFQINDEAQTIPAMAPYQVNTNQTWQGDVSVVYASNSMPLTKVDSNPAEGEYSVSEDGLYTFAAADAGEDLLLTYSYVPADVEQAVIELVGQGFKYKDRIGINSKTLGGQETIAYDNSFVTTRITNLLNDYKKVSPI